MNKFISFNVEDDDASPSIRTCKLDFLFLYQRHINPDTTYYGIRVLGMEDGEVGYDISEETYNRILSEMMDND